FVTIMDADSGLIIDDLEQEENSENVDPDEDDEAAEQVQFEKGTTNVEE
uniref:Preprotein translocase subunit YajC n=1 Tax=Globodera pallida TaxID=36090 RepID=A0A183CU53_GLOPA